MTEMVTISKEEYDELIERSNWLGCLEGAGVDDWDGYDYAQEMYAQEYDQTED